jgi:hypothetical protein
MNTCRICGNRTWNYEPGIQVCREGHKSYDLVASAPLDPVIREAWPYRWLIVIAWLLSLVAVIVTELVVG